MVVDEQLMHIETSYRHPSVSILPHLLEGNTFISLYLFLLVRHGLASSNKDTALPSSLLPSTSYPLLFEQQVLGTRFDAEKQAWTVGAVSL